MVVGGWVEGASDDRDEVCVRALCAVVPRPLWTSCWVQQQQFVGVSMCQAGRLCNSRPCVSVAAAAALACDGCVV